MVTIRLSRYGRTKAPSYRLVVADQRMKRDGRVIEFLGHYNPKKDKKLQVHRERVAYWISKGAQPTRCVAHLLKRVEKSH